MSTLGTEVVAVRMVGAALNSLSVACADGILVVCAVGCIFVGVVVRGIVSLLGAVDLLPTGTIEDEGLVVTLESVGDGEMLLGGSIVGGTCIGEMEGTKKGVAFLVGAPMGASCGECEGGIVKADGVLLGGGAELPCDGTVLLGGAESV